MMDFLIVDPDLNPWSAEYLTLLKVDFALETRQFDEHRSRPFQDKIDKFAWKHDGTAHRDEGGIHVRTHRVTGPFVTLNTADEIRDFAVSRGFSGITLIYQWNTIPTLVLDSRYR